MRDYLLQWRPENDKSQFLAQAGYTKQHAHRLADDIRDQLLKLEAEFEGTTEYGEVYRRRFADWSKRSNTARQKYLDDRERNEEV